MTTIHTRIKQRREALGMSMKTLAEMVGVSAWQTVQQWEREDGTAPKRDRLESVANALQTTPEELLFGSDAPESKGGQLDPKMSLPVANLSPTGMQVGRAFDRLNNKQRAALLALLESFDAI